MKVDEAMLVLREGYSVMLDLGTEQYRVWKPAKVEPATEEELEQMYADGVGDA